MSTSDSESVLKMSEIISTGLDTEGFEFNSHPLLCSPVLENVFIHLSMEELKICRSVCQRWKANSFLQMKNNSMNPIVRICLTHEDRIQEFLKNHNVFSAFQRFKFIFSIESVPLVSQFMTQFKTQIKDVTFVIGKDVNNPNCNSNMADNFLSFLAQYSSTWESFGIEINEESGKEAPSTPFESYEVNWSKLKSLSITEVEEYPIFIPILEKSTKLEKLVVESGPPFHTYQSCIENLFDSLTEFELVSGWYEPFRSDIISRLTKLKRFKIYGSSSSCRMTIPALPQLYELSINLNSDYVIPNFEPSTVFPNLVTLKWGSLTLTSEFIKFPIIFPNLKKLCMKYPRGHTSCTKYWKYFRKIEELWVDCENVNDEGIIGYRPTSSHKKIRHHKNGLIDWSSILESNWSDRNETRVEYDGIQTLTELKNVTINAVRISNMSIILGLLKCKSLRSIQLVSPSPYLTKDILKWMADELNLLNLSIALSHFEWNCSDEANYFRMKHPLCQLKFTYKPYEI